MVAYLHHLVHDHKSNFSERWKGEGVTVRGMCVECVYGVCVKYFGGECVMESKWNVCGVCMKYLGGECVMECEWSMSGLCVGC